MRPIRLAILFVFLIGLVALAAACGPSEADQAETVTANAAAAETAAAPTATPEPTDTPRPTDTPTAVPSPTPPPVEGLMEASSAAMAALESFSFEMVMEMSIAAEGLTMDIPLTMSGVTEPPDKSHITTSMSMMGMTFDFEMIQIGDEFFMTNPETGEWQSVTAEEAEANALVGGAFLNPQDMVAADPQDLGQLEFVGTEELVGVETHHLSTTMTMDQEQPAPTTFDVDFWIGADDNLVRQVTLSGEMSGEALGDLDATLPDAAAMVEATITFSGFDEAVTIEAPEVTASSSSGSISGVQVNGVAFSPDGQNLATVDDNGTIQIYDLADLSTPAAEWTGDFFVLNAVAFTPAGDLVAGGGDQLVYLWPAADLSADPVELGGHTDWIRALAASPDGRWLASTGDDTLVFVWEIADLEAEPAVLEGHTDWVRALAFSGDNRWLASAGDDTVVRLWDTSDLTAAPVELSSHDDWVRAVAFSPDGQWLASAGDDRVIRLWNLADLEAEPVMLEGHEDWVKALSFAPDSSFLASAGDDATILLWNMADPSAAPLSLPGHEEYISSVAFSPDGQYLVSADIAGQVLVWDISAAEPSYTVLGE